MAASCPSRLVESSDRGKRLVRGDIYDVQGALCFHTEGIRHTPIGIFSPNGAITVPTLHLGSLVHDSRNLGGEIWGCELPPKAGFHSPGDDLIRFRGSMYLSK